MPIIGINLLLFKTPVLDLLKLQKSVVKLIDHHDNFRMRFSLDNQYYEAHAKSEEIKLLDIRTLGLVEGSAEFEVKLQEILTSWQSNFNLERGPIYSIGYIYGYADQSARIYFALHHLIVDTVSWRVLSEDLRNLYYQKELGAKGSSYRQWVKYRRGIPQKPLHMKSLLARYII